MRKVNAIRSHKHEVFMETIKKVALSANDDKRIIIEEEIFCSWSLSIKSMKNMNHDNVLSNSLIVEPTHSGKTGYLVNLSATTFQGEFNYIIFLCPTFIHNET